MIKKCGTCKYYKTAFCPLAVMNPDCFDICKKYKEKLPDTKICHNYKCRYNRANYPDRCKWGQAGNSDCRFEEKKPRKPYKTRKGKDPKHKRIERLCVQLSKLGVSSDRLGMIMYDSYKKEFERGNDVRL